MIEFDRGFDQSKLVAAHGRDLRPLLPTQQPHLRRHVQRPLQKHREALRDEEVVRHARAREAQGQRADLPPFRVHLVERQVGRLLEIVAKGVEIPACGVDFGVGGEPRARGARCG